MRSLIKYLGMIQGDTSFLTKAFLKDSNGNVKGIKTINVDFVDGKLTEIDGTEKTWDAELVLLSMGFLSPEHYLSDDANIELDERGNYQSKHGEFNTSRKGDFFCWRLSKRSITRCMGN